MNKWRPVVLEKTTELADSFVAFSRELTGAVARKTEKARAASLLGLLAPGRSEV